MKYTTITNAANEIIWTECIPDAATTTIDEIEKKITREGSVTYLPVASIQVNDNLSESDIVAMKDNINTARSNDPEHLENLWTQ